MNTDYNPVLWCRDMSLLSTVRFFLPVDAFLPVLLENEKNQ